MRALRRRDLLCGLAVGTVSLTGCLTDPTHRAADESQHSDDGDDSQRNDDEDHSQRNGEGGDDDEGVAGDDDGEVDKAVVEYGTLPEYDQRFVDQAMSYHNVRWITEDGERTYIERSGDGWMEVEDPLVATEVGGDLRAVMDGEKHLKKDGTRYGFLMDVGHGPYGRRYRAVSVDTCGEEVVALADLDAKDQELLAYLVEHGDLFIAEPAFEDVSDADFFLEVDDDRSQRLNETFLVDEHCLASDGEVYEIEIDAEYSMHAEGYELRSVVD